MCEPVSITLGVSAVAGLAMQAYQTNQANKAAKKQSAALEEQAAAQMKAEERQAAFNKIDNEDAVKAQLARNRSLLGAFGVQSFSGTAGKLLTATAASGAMSDLTNTENLNNSIFSLRSGLYNKQLDIGEGIRQRNFKLVQSAFNTTTSVFSGGFGGYGSTGGYSASQLQGYSRASQAGQYGSF